MGSDGSCSLVDAHHLLTKTDAFVECNGSMDASLREARKSGKEKATEVETLEALEPMQVTDSIIEDDKDEASSGSEAAKQLTPYGA